jgi:tetratricopeptide (TPR) repeat protein
VRTERWETIDRVFAEALERPVGERERFVAEASGDDAEIADQVHALLRSHDEAPIMLGESATAFAEPLLERFAEEPMESVSPARRIGPYRVLREIGRGGMGSVYLAEREDQFRRQVAVKVVRRGMDTDEILLRFRYERQILAALEHPNIARLYDGGVADDGLPYLVMEYVEGRPITGYCADERLGLDARLRLFRTVCQAVQFAHQNLVVHRDVKPSNILVTGDGTPKLLDFGIAKLLTPDPGDAAPHTRTGVRILTPEYAAPEQIRGGAITTATDVYALGVLLYELLTGSRPIALEGKGPYEAEQAVLEQEPMRLSAAPGVPARLRRRLRGDLDSIARRAVEKDPQRRYQSALELLEDVDRHLAGLPVRARRSTLGYRLRSYVRRHRAGLATAAAFLALAAGFATVYNVRVTRERDRARAEASKATATTEFVTGLFAGADPDESPGDTLDVFDLLKRGAGRLTTSEVAEPEVLATLQATLGRLYLELGDYPQARPLLDSAVVLRRALHGPEHEEVGRALRDAAQVRTLMGDYPAADSLYRQAVAVQRRRLGEGHREVAVTLNYLADMLAQSGRADSAEPLFRQALAILEAAPGDERGEIAMSKFGLGVVKRYQGRFDQAEPLFREVLQLRRALYGNEQTDVAVTLNDLGILYLETGRYDSAEATLKESLAIRRKLFGNRHREVAQGLNNLAFVPFEHRKDYAGADSLWREALGIWQGMHGRNHRDVGMVLGNLGQLELERGNPDSASALYAEALGVMRAVSGEESADAARMTRNLGMALYRAGRLAAAQGTLERAVAIRRAVHGPSHLGVAAAELSLAHLLRDRGELDRAESLYARSIAMWRELGGDREVVGLGLNGWGRLRLFQRRLAEADSLQREALLIALEHHPEGGENVALARSDLGTVLVAAGRLAEAESLLVAAFPGLGPYDRPAAQAALAVLERKRGRRGLGAGVASP